MILSRGVWYMLLAIFFFSLMGLIVKSISEIPAIEIVFFRSIISLILSLGLLKMQRLPVWGNNKPLLILRGLTGAITLVTYFHILQEIPLASAVILGYLSPIMSTLLGIFIVKEKVSGWQWLFYSISFLGIFMVEGFDHRVPWIIIGLGIMSAFFSGIAQTIIRKLNTTEHPLVIILYFPLVTAPLSGLYCFLFEWVQPNFQQLILLILVGILTQIAQYFMTKSIQLEEISKVSILRFLSIVFALGFGYFIFGETYTLVAFTGMFFTILGVILNLVHKQKTNNEPKLEKV